MPRKKKDEALRLKWEQERAQERLVRMAEENDYKNLRWIDGLLCALQPFTYTWGIVVDIGEWSYERRYCYENLVDAIAAYGQYEDPRNTHPTGPWIKVKGRFKGLPVDDVNPLLFRIDPQTGLWVRKEDEDEQEETAQGLA